MALEDYKDLVGNAASICTIAQMFSGMFLCKDIVKQGSTNKISVIPFLGGLVIGSLYSIYALILDDEVMIRCNIVGMALNVGYFVCYFIYHDAKGDLVFKLIQGSGIVMLAIGYVRWEDPANVEFRFGLVVTVLLTLLIASPLFSLGDVIRTQSTETLPYPMILSGTVVSFLWLLYGIILQNQFLQAQNIIGFTLNVVQLSLFVIYPSKPRQKQN